MFLPAPSPWIVRPHVVKTIYENGIIGKYQMILLLCKSGQTPPPITVDGIGHRILSSILLKLCADTRECKSNQISQLVEEN